MMMGWCTIGVLSVVAILAQGGCEFAERAQPTPTPHVWTSGNVSTLPYRKHGAELARVLLRHYTGWAISDNESFDKPVEEALDQGCVGAEPRLLHAARDAYEVNKIVAHTPPNEPIDPSNWRTLLDLLDNMVYEARLAVDAHKSGAAACSGSAPCPDAYNDTWMDFVWLEYQVGEPNLGEVGWGKYVC